ncbi:GAF domain-containing protein [bacterium]|nr:MAG: GAF domain-containing protein [bacterium]
MRFSDRLPAKTEPSRRPNTVSDRLKAGLDGAALLLLARRALRLDAIAQCTVDEGWVDVKLAAKSRAPVSSSRTRTWPALSRMLEEQEAHSLVGEDHSSTAAALQPLPAGSSLAAARVDDRTVIIAGRRGRFTAQDLRDLQLTATASGLVRRNQDLLADLRRGARVSSDTVRALKLRNRQQHAIAELGLMASSGGSEEQLIEMAVDQVADVLRVEFVKVIEAMPGGRTARVRAGIGWPEGVVGSDISMADIPQAALAMETNRSAVVRNIQTDRRFKPSRFLIEHGIVSGISSVIRGKTAPFGELGVHSPRLRRFSRDDVNFVRAMANTLAEAITARRAETELRSSLQALHRTAEERHRLMRRLVDAVEEERKRIAGDVHDDYLQVLAAVTLRLGVLARQIRDPARKEMIGGLAQTVETASNRLRGLIFELRADALQDGLAAALRSYLAEIWEGGPVTWSVNDEKLTDDPPPDLRLVAYRICQEAISNVRKHSGASRMAITLANVDGGLLAGIADNGAGFDAKAHLRPQPGHLGLVAMRERAELASGWLRVKSRIGKGSNVEFWIPFEAVPEPPMPRPEARRARQRKRNRAESAID